jgi:opacity protein-like surface antigen
MSARSRLPLLLAPALAAAGASVAHAQSFVDDAQLPSSVGTLPTFGELYLPDEAVYLQARPDAELGTDRNEYRSPSYYARGAVAIWFPEDLTFTRVTSFAQTVVDPADPQNPTVQVVGQPQEVTHGWGGGLNFAGGYNFAPDAFINPRIEAEYLLLIVDYRDTNDDGLTWNSLGVNLLLDVRANEAVKVYGGVGAGMAYISYANPPLGNIGVGSDDAFDFYLQGLVGTLIRFNDDIDIDIGLRYQITEPEAFEGEVELNNILFHVGLLLHLE